MATEKWAAGAVSTWTALFGSEINSIVNGNAILSSVVFDNTSNLDGFCQIGVNLGSITSGAGYPYLGLAFYELGISTAGNVDGTVYGDGRFGSSAAGPPAGLVAFIPVPASVTGIITWSTGKIAIPLKKFKPVLYNVTGATLAGSANNVSIQTFNRVIS